MLLWLGVYFSPWELQVSGWGKDAEELVVVERAAELYTAAGAVEPG